MVVVMVVGKAEQTGVLGYTLKGLVRVSRDQSPRNNSSANNHSPWAARGRLPNTSHSSFCHTERVDGGQAQ
ncbi:hypothetical protein INR49_030116 [Caranx melampygus]|nr:hypothetical protein INR49_030116 [Caranx melampygus]